MRMSPADLLLYRNLHRMTVRFAAAVAAAALAATVTLGFVGCGSTTPTVSPEATIHDSVMFEVNPPVVVRGESFELTWRPVVGAAAYRVEYATSVAFERPDGERTVRGTSVSVRLPPGAHWFRVRPLPESGLPWSDPQMAYTLGGGGVSAIQEVLPGHAPAGDTVTVIGENLDYPGTRVEIGAVECPIVAASWNRLLVRLPPTARTGGLYLYSPLDGGAAMTGPPFVVDRIAWVTYETPPPGDLAPFLTYYPGDIDGSGVAVFSPDELDEFDPRVFDLLVIGDNTGTAPGTWAGGGERRAVAVARSGVPIVALGLGGAIFLLDAGMIDGAEVVRDVGEWIRAELPVHQTLAGPHDVMTPGSPEVMVTLIPEAVVAFTPPPGGFPVGVKAVARLPVTGAVAALDFAPQTGGPGARVLFWGTRARPVFLAAPGAEWLSNLVAAQYRHGPR